MSAVARSANGRGRVVGRQEGIDQDSRVTVRDLERGVAEESDLHQLSTLSISGSAPFRWRLRNSSVRSHDVSACSGW
jgi:hypothetical protein